MLRLPTIELIFVVAWSVGRAKCTAGPILGLVLLHARSDKFPPNTNFVLKAYSKWLEQVNIRWIPMFLDEPESETQRKLALIDGLFLTGGSEPLWNNLAGSTLESELLSFSKTQEPSAYMRYISRLVKAAVAFNDSGRFFPIWGTCLGFESLLLVLSDFQVELSTGLADINKMHSVSFDRRKQSVFSEVFGEADFRQFDSEQLLYFYHDFGFLYDQTVNHPFVRENIDVLAKATTLNGTDIVAAYQHKKYPFAAIQYHPEKNQFVFADHMPKIDSDKLTDVGRGHARVAAALFSVSRFLIDFETFEQMRTGMNQIFDDGNQSESFFFGPYHNLEFV